MWTGMLIAAISLFARIWEINFDLSTIEFVKGKKKILMSNFIGWEGIFILND